MFFSLVPIIAVLRGTGNDCSREEISRLLGATRILPSDEIAKLTQSDSFFFSHVPATEEEREEECVEGFYELTERTSSGSKLLLRVKATHGPSIKMGPGAYWKFNLLETPAGYLKVYTPPPAA